jgi:hypothetical protein
MEIAILPSHFAQTLYKMSIWIENDKLTDRKPCHFMRIAGKIQGLSEINAKLWVLQERTLSKQLI